MGTRRGGARASSAALEELADDPSTPTCSGSTTTSRATGSSTIRTERIRRTSNEVGRIAQFVDVEVARVPGFEVDGFWRSRSADVGTLWLPMALTEVHLGGDPEDEVAWWAEAWQQAGWAVAEGMDVEGVTSWAAFGGVDWNSLLRFEAGYYRPGCFDVRSGEAVRTQLGEAVAATAAGRPVNPVGTGWWRQPDRLLPVPAPDIAA